MKCMTFFIAIKLSIFMVKISLAFIVMWPKKQETMI